MRKPKPCRPRIGSWISPSLAEPTRFVSLLYGNLLPQTCSLNLFNNSLCMSCKFLVVVSFLPLPVFFDSKMGISNNLILSFNFLFLCFDINWTRCDNFVKYSWILSQFLMGWKINDGTSWEAVNVWKNNFLSNYVLAAGVRDALVLIIYEMRTWAEHKSQETKQLNSVELLRTLRKSRNENFLSTIFGVHVRGW